MVRIGIGILGIDPSDSYSKGLMPALNVHAKLSDYENNQILSLVEPKSEKTLE